MAFLKRYPILVAVLAICVLGFAVEVFFLIHFRSKADEERNRLQGARTSLSIAEALVPAPTDDNQTKAQQNVDALKKELTDILATFQKTALQIPDAPSEGTKLMLDIQSYVDHLRDVAKNHNVLLPPENEFGFGMKQYLGQVTPPPKDKITAVFKQKFILQYILEHLMVDCKPTDQYMFIRSVRREDVTASPASVGSEADSDMQRNELFQIDKLVSARVPGAIDTLAFRIEYVGFTDSLRKLLNTLSHFDLPLVVRSIDVDPASTDAINAINAAIKAANPTAATVPAAVSGNAGGGNTAEPVVKENLSKFTVVIEYIELTLPPPGAKPPAEEGGADGAAATPTDGAAPAGTDAGAAPAPANT